MRKSHSDIWTAVFKRNLEHSGLRGSGPACPTKSYHAQQSGGDKEERGLVPDVKKSAVCIGRQDPQWTDDYLKTEMVL